jgi:heme A synthase
MQEAETIAAASGRAGAISDRLRSLLQFRYLALATVIATYGLIVLGGTVRATNSGTACPDWPLCYGQVIPPFETKVLIEFSHRLAASIVGFMILGTVIWIWRKHRANRLMLRAGVAAGLLLALQVLVGGATVNTETAATVVAIHLSIALTLLAVLILIAAGAFRLTHTETAGETGWSGQVGALRPLPVLAALSALVLIISGAYVSQTGAGLAYPDWPLFDGQLVSAGGKLANIHYIHRVVAAAAGVLVLALAVQTLRRDRRHVMVGAVTLAFAIYVVQVFVGASNIWLDLATPVRIAHLALASALWAVLVFTVTWAYLEQPAPAEERIRHD